MTNQSKQNYSCPLCTTSKPDFFHQDKARQYFKCAVCSLVFVPPKNHLSQEKEKTEYDLHQNSPNDVGYRNFLKRVFVPMCELIKPGSKGLDFGCGPGPTLSVMFEEEGHTMALYDHIYAIDYEPLTRKYDFITATEVVEHLRAPSEDLHRLWSILKPGGNLGMMTKLVVDKESFGRWHYIHDPTHICFFSVATMKWLANCWQAGLKLIGDDVALFHKQAWF